MHDLVYWKSIGSDVGFSINDARSDMQYVGKEEADITATSKNGSVVIRLVHPGGGTP